MNITAQNLAAAMLTDARRKLAEPDCWTQKASARDLSGVSVDVLDAGAVSFCVSGALLRAAAGAANGYDLPDIDPDNPPLALAFAALERAVAAESPSGSGIPPDGRRHRRLERRPGPRPCGRPGAVRLRHRRRRSAPEFRC